MTFCVYLLSLNIMFSRFIHVVPCISTSLLFFFNIYYLFIYLCIYLFIYFWLCWVFVSVRGLSLVAASGGHSSSWCAGLSLLRPLLLQSTVSRCAGSVVVAYGPSCSAACGISQTRARTHVPCIGRQILNHCATREAPVLHYFLRPTNIPLYGYTKFVYPFVSS